uniref:Uncharacterized protein n=1 Tax=Anguilla anguilla TaxID=7936 RepID=A0A0E9TET3_ANGAN
MIITSSWIQTRPLSTWQLNTATKYPKSPKSTCNFWHPVREQGSTILSAELLLQATD